MNNEDIRKGIKIKSVKELIAGQMYEETKLNFTLKEGFEQFILCK